MRLSISSGGGASVDIRSSAARARSKSLAYALRRTVLVEHSKTAPLAVPNQRTFRGSRDQIARTKILWYSSCDVLPDSRSRRNFLHPV